MLQQEQLTRPTHLASIELGPSAGPADLSPPGRVGTGRYVFSRWVGTMGAGLGQKYNIVRVGFCLLTVGIGWAIGFESIHSGSPGRRGAGFCSVDARLGVEDGKPERRPQ